MTAVCTNEVSELQYFLGETLHSLADDMARELGARLLLGMPVTEIRHGPDGVLVTARGQSFEAARAIVAVPPVMASRIAYAPALPEPLSRALGAWESGDRHQDQAALRSAPSGATGA